MTARRPSRLLAAICLLVLLEAALLVGLGVAFAVELVRGAQLPAAMVFLVVFLVAVAAVLGASARGLWRGRRWARSPVVTWQLLLVVLSIGWLQVEPSAWAVAVLVGALVIVAGLVVPSVVAATTGTAAGSDRPE
ncbi:hypothetical protein ACGIF2_14340 [Cellulomonas sp. P22]|uniref:hypothetical protein n=1 Tax=Cellulomonas sp. P22 TaxID=3373189 RepID=UPI0037A76657